MKGVSSRRSPTCARNPDALAFLAGAFFVTVDFFLAGAFFVVDFFVAIPRLYTLVLSAGIIYNENHMKKTAKTKTSKKTAPKRFHERVFESDGTYFLKLVVVVLLGTLWLKFGEPSEWLGLSLTAVPLGIIVGFLVVRAFEHHQEDRKIWYAVLLVVGVISYFVPAGIVI